MVKKRSNYIIFFSWFLVLVLLWIVISFFEGVNGQWWSMYRLNPHKYGLWSLELSYIKVGIAAVISLVIAYMVSFGFKRHK
jgi:ABC-type sulfate transport system permease component